MIKAYVYNPTALDGPRNDSEAQRLRCGFEYTQKIDRSMSTGTQCSGKINQVIAYRKEPGLWHYLGFCEMHGGVLKAEAELLSVADGDTIEWIT